MPKGGVCKTLIDFTENWPESGFQKVDILIGGPQRRVGGKLFEARRSSPEAPGRAQSWVSRVGRKMRKNGVWWVKKCVMGVVHPSQRGKEIRKMLNIDCRAPIATRN
jgi:hypothetical protein